MHQYIASDRGHVLRALLVFVFTALFLVLRMPMTQDASAAQSNHSNDIVIGDFQSSGWESWQADGTAFGNGPALGENAVGLGIVGIRGNGAATSKAGGDGPTGRLTSPTFKVDRRYITFFISGGSDERYTCINLVVDGEIVRSATGNDNELLLPVTWDVADFYGKQSYVQIVDQSTISWGHINIDRIVETDHPDQPPVITTPLYSEALRPQFHFTARQWTNSRLNPGPKEEGWSNDMNGLVYYDGEYHFFAQRWYRCWLHAVSKDLVHWTELKPAFYEESQESGVQSGNCVIDYNNTSGLSPSKADPPMVAFWAKADNQTISITYSLDHGRTWKFYDHNPILAYPERDPMVFWYKPTQRWVMMMYGNDQYHILTSTNLLSWKDENHPIPDSYECPDFFQLPLDGDKSQMKWVLVRGNGKYSIGSFNGTQFTEETPQYDSSGGPNFYATQSWGNVDTGDGRRIQAAWMRGGTYPNMPFNQQVTFPCVLTLHSTPNGPRLFREPIAEIASLHKHLDSWTDRTLSSGEQWTLGEPGDLFHIKMNVNVPAGATLTFDIRGIPLVITHDSIACQTGLQTATSEIKTIEILIDRTSVEAFGNDGEVSTSTCFLPDNDDLTFKADGAPVTISALSVYQLNSAWPTETEPLPPVVDPHFYR